MKAQRKTGRASGTSPSFKFVHRWPENILRVEEDPVAGVTIRATHNSFSHREKSFFVHYLAEEGFISERYRGFSAEQGGACPGLTWLVEECHSKHSSTTSGATRRTRTFMLRLLLCGSVLWLIELTFLFVRSR